LNDIAESTRQWQELDRRHYLHPFTHHKSLAAKGSRIITHAEGVYIYDSEGCRIFDAMAGLWCVNVGYGRHELVDAAAKQMRELPYYNSFFQSAHPPAVELAALLSEVTPASFNHAFFTGSGSESVDTVLRMVRRYWEILGRPHKSVVISRVNAYHGSTIAAGSLGGMKPMHAQGGLPIPGIVHIEQPYWFECGGDLSTEEFGLKTARALETKINEIGVDKVAAFIAEPIQGAGGVIIPPESYWPEIQRICDNYGILLVADEVICGFGRTGEWFGSDYFGIKPDLMPMAKGLSSGYLPIGAVMVGDRVADVLIKEGGDFHHGFTYSGHPVACAVAVANIEILRGEGVVENVKTKTGPYLKRRWQELESHPLVGESRIAGFLGAIELVRDKATRKRFEPKGRAGEICRDICFEKGLVMRAIGDTMVISPPLIASEQHIDELITLAGECLDQTATALGITR